MTSYVSGIAMFGMFFTSAGSQPHGGLTHDPRTVPGPSTWDPELPTRLIGIRSFDGHYVYSPTQLGPGPVTAAENFHLISGR